MLEPFREDHFQPVMEQAFAPWVQQLGLKLVNHGAEECTFAMPQSSSLVREGGPGGGVVCGQALAAAADTVSVFALALMKNKLRANTTTDFSIRFLRPIMMGDVKIVVRALSNGKRLAVTEVFFYADGSEKPGAHATCTFAFLDG